MKNFFIVISILALIVSVIIGCASIKTYLSGADTDLRSTSLAQASALRAMGITIAGTKEGNNWCITPNKISGEVMSVVLPCNGQEDEGIVAFGAGRPDIAPANSVLYPFDLSTTTKLHNDVVGLKPGYKGGQSQQIILLFGYFDVEFDQGTAKKTIRFVYGDSNKYVRGDKLLYNASSETTGKFYWYNTTAETFVSETASRPAYVCVNEYVRNFSDPVRPNMHYYMLGAQLRDCTDYDGKRGVNYITLNKSVVDDNSLTFMVDFDVQNAVLFKDVDSDVDFRSLTDAQLIEKFDMKQNTSRWAGSDLYCAISFEAKPKFK